MIDGSVKAGLPPSDVFAYDTGNMRVMGGDHIRYWVLPLDGPDLTIVLARLGGDDGFETTLNLALLGPSPTEMLNCSRLH
jgi:hypothetical protein